MTKSQINKLGERLRAATVPSEELLFQLHALRVCYQISLSVVQTRLRSELDIHAVHRLKTTNTIIEKLRREKMRLAQMQDIAGLRVVGQLVGLGEQDQIVSQIQHLFNGAKVIDRRASPSYGYRAVHVIVTAHEFPVEIQVRTSAQHGWAQAVEWLGDRVGRGIRYGDVPEGLTEPFELLQELSRRIAVSEQIEREHELVCAQLERLHKRFEVGTITDGASVEEQRDELLSLLPSYIRGELPRLEKELRAKLDSEIESLVELAYRLSRLMSEVLGS